MNNGKDESLQAGDHSASLDGFWRMADANWNRASEGVRVLEDFFRFVESDSILAFKLKTLRHSMTDVLKQWSQSDRIAARDSVADVGRHCNTNSEYVRAGDEDLVQANFARVSQSFRVLEETAKRLSLDSTQIESLRYDTYEIHRLASQRISNPQLLRRKRLLEKSQLYLLVDGFGDRGEILDPEEFAEKVFRYASAGVDVIQFRDKKIDDRTVYLMSKTGAGRLRNSNCLFIVNDRADLAVAAEADGVHVGQEELPVEEIRKLGGDELLIGLSTHSQQQVTQTWSPETQHKGAMPDYLGVGPVFPSQTKSFKSTVGTQLLHGVSGSLHLPAFAIGGISMQNLDQVLDAGFRRIAVSGAVNGSTDPIQEIVALKDRLTKGN